MSVIGAIFLFLLFGTIFFLAALVWSGPWPPKKAIADGREKPETRWQGMSQTTAIQAVVAAVCVWFIPFESVWFRYLVFMVLPLLLGLVTRRILSRRE